MRAARRRGVEGGADARPQRLPQAPHEAARPRDAPAGASNGQDRPQATQRDPCAKLRLTHKRRAAPLTRRQAAVDLWTRLFSRAASGGHSALGQAARGPAHERHTLTLSAERPMGPHRPSLGAGRPQWSDTYAASCKVFDERAQRCDGGGGHGTPMGDGTQRHSCHPMVTHVVSRGTPWQPMTPHGTP